MWRSYRFRAISPVRPGDVERAIESLNGLVEKVVVDRAGSGVVQGMRTVKVSKRGNVLVVRVGFRAQGARVWGEEFEVTVGQWERGVELKVRRVKGIGRVPEDFIAGIIESRLPLIRLREVRGGLVIAIEGLSSTRSTYSEWLLEWLESEMFDCELVRWSPDVDATVRGIERIVRRGGVAVCDGYVATAVTLESCRAPRRFKLPDVVAVVASAEKKWGRLVGACMRLYGLSPLVLSERIESSRAELKAAVMRTLAARGSWP